MPRPIKDEQSLWLVGSFAVGEEDRFSDLDLIWVGERTTRAKVRQRLIDADKGHLLEAANDRIDLLELTPAELRAHCEMGTTKAWSIQASAVPIEMEEGFEFPELGPSDFERHIRRLRYYLEHAQLFEGRSPAADASDAIFLYGIIRELSIACGGPHPRRENFVRFGIFEHLPFAPRERVDIASFIQTVRAYKINSISGSADAGFPSVLSLIREKASRLAEGARKHSDISPQWVHRVAFARKSAVMASIFERKFPRAIPLLTGRDDYTSWIEDPAQEMSARSLVRIAAAHRTAVADLARSAGSSDSLWSNHVEALVECVSPN